MAASERSQQELFELWFAVHDETATPEQIDALNQLIAADAEVRGRLLSLARQQSWLMWHGSAATEPDNLDAILTRVNSAMEVAGAWQMSAAPQAAPPIVAPSPGAFDQDTGLVLPPAPPENAFMTSSDNPQQRPILISLRDFFLRGTGAMSRAAAALLLIGSLCVGALLAMIVTMVVMKTPAQAQHFVVPTYVAQLTAAHNLRWANDAVSPMVDQLLAEGQDIEIVSGWAEITFKSGARVVLEGPASLDVQSADSGRLNAGKLAVEVSPRSKFVVDTPTSRVVDLGAEFGMRVAPDGATTIEVFTGTVDVHPLTDDLAGAIGPPERLTDFQAVRAERPSGDPTSKIVLKRVASTNHLFVRTLRTKNHILGSQCIGRAVCDIAQGVVVLMRDPTTKTGRATSFSFYNVHADNNRWITPVILAFDRSTSTYRITGIGQSVLNLGTGQQTVPFQLIVGSGDLQADIHTFGFYHGTVDKTGKATSASLGPLDFDRVYKPSDVASKFPGHVNPPESEGRWIFTPMTVTPVPLCIGLEFNADPGPEQVLLSPSATTFLDVERVYSGRLEIVTQPEFPPIDLSTNVSQIY